MGNSFRAQPLPTQYPAMRSSVTEDVLQVGLAYASGIIAVSFILIIPGIRGWERLWAAVRVLSALMIGTVILMSNFGSWYAGSICTSTQYKAHTSNSNQYIEAKVGISIDLRGFNITLMEMENGCEGSEKYVRPFPGEHIHYVERFQWAPSWRQGIQDFGKYGGQILREYRAAKYRGLPYPVMWVAEYFVLDGEQFIWYRKFRLAGWYTHILMWLSFATYLYSILLFLFNIRYGAYFMFLTGGLLIIATLSYGLHIQNNPPFRIPFPDGILRPTFSLSFYMTAVTGVLTVVMAGMLLLMNYLNPRVTAILFHHSYIKDDTMLEGEIEEEDEELSSNLKHDYFKRNEVSSKMKRVIKQRRESRRNSILSRKGSILSRNSLKRKRKSSYMQAQSLGLNIPDKSSDAPATGSEKLRDQCAVEMLVQVTVEADVGGDDKIPDQEEMSGMAGIGAKEIEQETNLSNILHKNAIPDIQQNDKEIDQLDQGDKYQEEVNTAPIVTTV